MSYAFYVAPSKSSLSITPMTIRIMSSPTSLTTGAWINVIFINHRMTTPTIKCNAESTPLCSYIARETKAEFSVLPGITPELQSEECSLLRTVGQPQEARSPRNNWRNEPRGNHSEISSIQRDFVNFPLQIFNTEVGFLFRFCQWRARNNFNISQSQVKLER